jgi:flagellar motility protein MotE (MotC chaperone)
MDAPDTIRSTRRRRLRQRSLLTVLGIVFAISAVLRIGTLDFAFAEAANDVSPDAARTPASTRTIDANLARGLQDAIAELEGLRLDLQRREAEISDRERAVATAQALVQDRLAELEAAEARLETLIATSDQAAETDLDRLTRVYETMPADTAAALFGQMPPSFAAGFLARMTPSASAALMAELLPEQAYAISVVLATRNSSAPRLGPDASSEEDTES